MLNRNQSTYLHAEQITLVSGRGKSRFTGVLGTLKAYGY